MASSFEQIYFDRAHTKKRLKVIDVSLFRLLSLRIGTASEDADN